MKLLYISYWSINDPLTISTVMPALSKLKRHFKSDRITLVTIERENANYPKYNIPYDFVDHVPLTPPAQQSFIATKTYEMVRVPKKIEALGRKLSVDLIYARTSLAGMLAYKVAKSLNVPFIVDSFEPHGDYMVNAGAWNETGLKYKYARKYLLRQMQSARYLITVTDHYRQYLHDHEHVPLDKLRVIPCTANLDKMVFLPSKRTEIRERLGISPSAKVAIYLGKLGGLYYEEEAFKILNQAFNFFTDLYVIMLGPNDKEKVLTQLEEYDIPKNRVHIDSVPKEEVAAYLSAADFAYSFVKPTPTGLFQSPVKHGEYWACGLPFITPDQISDDCEIIQSEGGGAVLSHDLSNIDACHEAILELIINPGYREEIRKLALKYKNESIIDDVLSGIARELLAENV